MSYLIEPIVSLMIVIGAAFALLGSVGLLRFPTFFSRLHAPTKSATLGVGALLIGAIVLPLAQWRAPGIAEIMLTFFVFVTAPVSANMLSLAAFRQTGDEPANEDSAQ